MTQYIGMNVNGEFNNWDSEDGRLCKVWYDPDLEGPMFPNPPSYRRLHIYDSPRPLSWWDIDNFITKGWPL